MLTFISTEYYFNNCIDLIYQLIECSELLAAVKAWFSYSVNCFQYYIYVHHYNMHVAHTHLKICTGTLVINFGATKFKYKQFQLKRLAFLLWVLFLIHIRQSCISQM